MNRSPTNSTKNLQASPTNVINNNNINNNLIFNEIFKKLSSLTDQEEIEFVLRSLMEVKTPTASHHSHMTNQSDSLNSRATKASGDTNQLFGCSLLGMPTNNDSSNNEGEGEVTNEHNLMASATMNQMHSNERSISDVLSIGSQKMGPSISEFNPKARIKTPSLSPSTSPILNNDEKNYEAKKYPQYSSEYEIEILKSQEPLEVTETDEAEVFGQRGIWVNKLEVNNWRGEIPIEQYPINKDFKPKLIVKKPQRNIEYTQEIAVRYLRPPTPPAPGDIIIREQEPKRASPPPPIIIRQHPTRARTPSPMVIRERPPNAPPLIGRKIITISGKKCPPPPRKVIIERLPQLPPKPPNILIERWLPYKQVKRRVIYQTAPESSQPVYVKPRNIIVQWQSPDVVIKNEYKHLDVVKADPNEYVRRYGNTLYQSKDLPNFVKEIKTPHGIVLAANLNPTSCCTEDDKNLDLLEGDVEALQNINLDAEGLSEYKACLDAYLKKNEHKTN